MIKDGDKMIYIVLAVVITIIAAGLIIFLNLSNKQKKDYIRINTAEEAINASLDERLNLLKEIEQIINNSTELNQNNFKSLNIDELDSFEFDRKLSKITELFNKIRSDYEVELDKEDFRDLMTKLKINEEKNEASKSYYNKYAEDLNSRISSFPANIIAKISGTDKKEMFDINKFKQVKTDIVVESKI